jgi:hypothetical protein
MNNDPERRADEWNYSQYLQQRYHPEEVSSPVSFPEIHRIYDAMAARTSFSGEDHTYADRLIDVLVERGWDRRSVSYMFRFLSDGDVGDFRPRVFARLWFFFLLRELELAMQTPQVCLCEMGVRPRVIRQLLRRIVYPLQNTCYSDPQLVDISIEYLLGWKG